MNTCPVCGYPELLDRPQDYEICPSCGTEFGYTDIATTHAELTRQWMAKGMPWHARWLARPDRWNPEQQLANVGLFFMRPRVDLVTTTTRPSGAPTRIWPSSLVSVGGMRP